MSWFKVLVVCALIPSLLSDNLFCYNSPILEKGRKFKLRVTKCLPHEVCFKAVGRYGVHRALSQRGCRAQEDCNQINIVHHKGTDYNMTYTCCDKPYCNSCMAVGAKPYHIAAALVIVAVITGGSCWTDDG